jgi:hypothetical protein
VADRTLILGIASWPPAAGWDREALLSFKHQ